MNCKLEIGNSGATIPSAQRFSIGESTPKSKKNDIATKTPSH